MKWQKHIRLVLIWRDSDRFEIYFFLPFSLCNFSRGVRSTTGIFQNASSTSAKIILWFISNGNNRKRDTHIKVESAVCTGTLICRCARILSRNKLVCIWGTNAQTVLLVFITGHCETVFAVLDMRFFFMYMSDRDTSSRIFFIVHIHASSVRWRSLWFQSLMWWHRNLNEKKDKNNKTETSPNVESRSCCLHLLFVFRAN